MRQILLKVAFTPALIPERMTATAVVTQGVSKVFYHSEWAEAGTRFPLQRWSSGGRTLLAGLGPVTSARRAWLTDLDVVKSPGMIAVRTHGDDRGKPQMVVQTSWFIHLQDHPDEIWIAHRLERQRAPLLWELMSPAASLRVSGAGIKVANKGGRTLVTAPVGESWDFRVATAKAAPLSVALEIAPPENERAFVDRRKPFELAVRVVNLTGRKLTGGVIRVYGLDRVFSTRVDLPAGGSAAVAIKVDAGSRKGIVPVAARFEHPAGVGLGTRSLWIPQVVLTTDQPWLDGMYAENLRSAIHRFTFNMWREDEPRYPCYRDGMFNRNIHTALIAMDEPRRLWGWVRHWLMALRSCGFMPEAYGLVTPPLRHIDWLKGDLGIGNDGAGFTLIQWGKLFLHADNVLRRQMLDSDLDDLFIFGKYIRRSTHWNGQIDDHSEPVDGIRTVALLAGSPFAQSLCLAGVALVRRALAEALETAPLKRRDALTKLVELYASLSIRLRAGLDKLTEKDGAFADITSDQNQHNPHTYTNLAAGMFLCDPDLEQDAYDNPSVLSRTIACNAAYHPKGRPYRVLTCPYWKPHPGFSHQAYAQIAMIFNQLALGREDAASQYLGDLCRSAQADFTRHRVSDPDYTVMEWDVKDRGFSKYIIPEGVLPGQDEVKLNPGNGVNVSYFLHLIDRMIGIRARRGTIEIAPRLAGQKQWEVDGYPTRLGPVSYRLKAGDGDVLMECAAATPVVITLPLPPLAKSPHLEGLAPGALLVTVNKMGVRQVRIAVGAGAKPVKVSLRLRWQS